MPDVVSTEARFGPFTFDVRTGELLKGSRITVPDQSIEILRTLLERPGALITREELRQRLWPDNTFVDLPILPAGRSLPGRLSADVSWRSKMPMSPQPLESRVEALEGRVTSLEALPARIDALELQIVQLRGEMHGECSAVRAEIRELRDETRQVNEETRRQIQEGDEETRRQMREGDEDTRQLMRELNDETRRHMLVLHEDVVGRIALLQERLVEPRPRKQRKS